MSDGRYVNIEIDGKRYLAHRLAWFYVYGSWPHGLIDHINGKKADNRIGNLRDCNKSLNAVNAKTPATNTSGYRGVSWCKRSMKWRASIKVAGRSRTIGYFSSKEVASSAYSNAAKDAFGSFHREPEAGV